jgi:hypothetical protein
MKRVLLTVGCFTWQTELVTMLIIIEMTHLCYLLHAMPYIARFNSKLEIFTELTILGLLYVLQGFRGSILSPDK